MGDAVREMRGFKGLLATGKWYQDEATRRKFERLLMPLAASYFLYAKSRQKPADPVARFHLGNGARLDRINWLADTSNKGLRESATLMVNYAYIQGDDFL